MKKTIRTLLWLLAGLQLLLPLGAVAAHFFGYRLVLTNAALSAAAPAAVAALLAALCSVRRDALPTDGVSCVLLALIAPLSLLPFTFFVLIRGTVTFWTMAALFLMDASCVYLCVRFGLPFGFRITCMVLAALAVQPAVLIGFLELSGGFGETTVLQTLPSPNGTYCAELLEFDEGALGGRTEVWVYDKTSVQIPLPLMRLEKPPRKIYVGGWSEARRTKLQWQSDNCLRINSEDHLIG